MKRFQIYLVGQAVGVNTKSIKKVRCTGRESESKISSTSEEKVYGRFYL